MKKPYETFRKIIQYCKIMDYDVNDILEMSDNELRIWYNRVVTITENETDFRIKTGRQIDNRGREHKLLSIIDMRIAKR